MNQLTKRDFLVPAMLVVLSIVPVLGGVARLQSLSGPITAENARFLAMPVPVVLHVFGASAYCLLGAFQFSKGVRRRWPVWHRRAGRLLALCGLCAGLTGLWMTVFYTIPRDLQGPLVRVVRLAVGAGMVTAILLAWSSILRRDVARHEAWMVRAYALGQGAGTQALILLPWAVLFGHVVGLPRDLLMTLAWAINILVAEWIIRRSARASQPAARPVSLSDVRA
jgi:hypothetical protein